MNARPAIRDDIDRLFGNVTDHAALKVLESGATLEDLEAVALWLTRQDEESGASHIPLTGVPAQVLYWLENDQGFPDEDVR